MEIKITNYNDPKYDHENILINGLQVGYQAKDDSRAGLTRCPKCKKENYVLSVSSGRCAWCKFNLNDFINDDDLKRRNN